MKINKEATLDNCRRRYGSVAATARAFGVPSDHFYKTVRGIRGQSNRRVKPRRGGGTAKDTLERLRAEGLLVVEEESPERMAG